VGKACVNEELGIGRPTTATAAKCYDVLRSHFPPRRWDAVLINVINPHSAREDGRVPGTRRTKHGGHAAATSFRSTSSIRGDAWMPAKALVKASILVIASEAEADAACTMEA
jgi:hypothetical protein